MQTADLILIFKIIIAILLLIMGILIVSYFLMDRKKNEGQKEKNTMIKDGNTEEQNKDKKPDHGVFRGELTQESIYDFMEFEEIKDGMIIRKNRTQYVMVLQCNGVNYDLMSEPERIAVEEGFVQFLNTLRFPIQLYVQSRTLNLKDILEEYEGRIIKLQNDIQKLDAKMVEAKAKGNRSLIEKIEFERRRKINVLEYGMDITDYVERMSSNRNILQQKTFVIVSYYSAEIGGSLENYSKDEIDSMCFTELYTRCQNVASALGNSQINSSILDSEELSELLYIAYNRDESELLQLSKALDSQYDSLYSTGKDVYQKQKEMLNEQILVEAMEIATDSLVKADKLKKMEEWGGDIKKEKIKEKAKEILAEYEDRLDDRVFELAIEQIDEQVEKKFSASEDKTKNKKVEGKEKIATKKIVRKKKTEDK